MTGDKAALIKVTLWLTGRMKGMCEGVRGSGEKEPFTGVSI